MKFYWYQGYLQDCSWKKIINDTKKLLLTHHFFEKGKLLKYLGGLLSVNIDEADLENRTNQLINDISNFNK